MRPYGQIEHVRGWPNKVDHHLHSRGRKVGNWWQDCDTTRSRGHMRQITRKQIKDTIDDDKH
jgi:hypothetical protein